MQKDELEYLEFSNHQSSLKLTLQGAHIFDFQVKGKAPLLFLSEKRNFKKDIAIRGGIPICWPWFGEHPEDKSLPNHGFARILQWEHLDTKVLSPDKTKISLGLKNSSESLKYWEYAFELRLEIVMSDILEIALITKNTGTKTFMLSQALHSYLKVDDVRKLSLEGLQNCKYFNKLDKSHSNIQEGSVQFFQELDRVYTNVKKRVSFKNKNEKLSVETRGSSTLVVWNPGKERVKKMPDLSDYKTMLCIESVNTLNETIELEPNTKYELRTSLSQTHI